MQNKQTKLIVTALITIALVLAFFAFKNPSHTEKKLKYIQATNAGLLGYFDNGSIVACPKCDFMQSNVDILYHQESVGSWDKNKTPESFMLEQNDPDLKSTWVMVDYGWVTPPGESDGNSRGIESSNNILPSTVTSSNTNISAGGANLATTTNQTKNNIQYIVSDYTLSLIENNSVRQTISLTPDAIESLSYASAKQMDLAGYNNIMFPTDQDVNFDGYNDVGVFQSSGYSGVNDFYDYYLYNPKTHLLEKSPTLTGISNPRVDVIHKKIISNYRSGPQWYSTTFTYINGGYVKSAEVKD